MRRNLAPLRHTPFKLLFSGQLASNVGDAFYAVALPWYVLSHHGGALLLGTVLAAYGVPRTALVAVGGHVADRFGAWTVMMWADSVRAVAVAALGVVALTGPARAGLLVPIAVVLGAGEGLFLPGSLAIVPSLLPDDDLQAGNALVSGGTQLAMLIGPAIGGAVVALVGPGPGFLVDCASFVVSAGTLAGITRAKRSPVQVTAPLAGVPLETATMEAPLDKRAMSVTSLLRSERVLQVILLVTLAANLGSGGTSEVALPSLARGPFHTGAAGYGGLIAAFGGGALLGTVVAGHFHGFRRPAMVASYAFAAEAVLMCLVPYLGGAIPAGVDLAFFGALNGFGNIVAITAVQRWAPPELLGRLMGVVLLASFGTFPLSVLLGGVVVHDLGPAPFFLMAGAVLGAAILAGLTQPAWRCFGVEAEVAEEAAPAGAAGLP